MVRRTGTELMEEEEDAASLMCWIDDTDVGRSLQQSDRVPFIYDSCALCEATSVRFLTKIATRQAHLLDHSASKMDRMATTNRSNIASRASPMHAPARAPRVLGDHAENQRGWPRVKWRYGIICMPDIPLMCICLAVIWRDMVAVIAGREEYPGGGVEAKDGLLTAAPSSGITSLATLLKNLFR